MEAVFLGLLFLGIAALVAARMLRRILPLRLRLIRSLTGAGVLLLASALGLVAIALLGVML